MKIRITQPGPSMNPISDQNQPTTPYQDSNPIQSDRSQAPRLTKVVSVRKEPVSTQKSPGYSETSIISTNNPVKIVETKRINRKFLGLPASMVIFLLVMTTVLAAGVLLKEKTRTLTVSAPITYTGTDGASFENSQALAMVAGDVKTFSVQVNNQANRAAPVTVRLQLSQPSLTNGEATITLDGVSDSTVEANTLTVEKTYTIPATGSQIVPFNVDLSFSASQENNYLVTLTTMTQS